MWIAIAIIVYMQIATKNFFVRFADQISTIGTQRKRRLLRWFAVPANGGGVVWKRMKGEGGSVKGEG
jgi:hypothetical protein